MLGLQPRINQSNFIHGVLHKFFQVVLKRAPVRHSADARNAENYLGSTNSIWLQNHQGHPFHRVIIQVYAATTDAEEEGDKFKDQDWFESTDYASKMCRL